RAEEARRFSQISIRANHAPLRRSQGRKPHHCYYGGRATGRDFLTSQFSKQSLLSEVIRQQTLHECAWSLPSDDRFRMNLSFAPDRLACENRRFEDRSRKPGWQAVFQRLS